MTNLPSDAGGDFITDFNTVNGLSEGNSKIVITEFMKFLVYREIKLNSIIYKEHKKFDINNYQGTIQCACNNSAYGMSLTHKSNIIERNNADNKTDLSSFRRSRFKKNS